MAYFRTGLFSFIISLSPSLWAYYSFHDSGHILPLEDRAVTTHVQFVPTENLQSNVVANYDWPLDSEVQLRSFMSLGNTFAAGIKYKWVPIPDYDKQPAMGLTFGGHFAQPSTSTEFALSFAPLISKEQSTPFGPQNLYAALPVSLQFYSGETRWPVQVIGGTFFKLKQYKNMKVTAEVGLDISNSFNYISVGVSIDYNEFDGFKVHQLY